MRYVRPPYPIHPRAEVCEGIFARLDDLLDMELAKFKGQRPSMETRTLRGFYEWARDTLDADQYADIQARLIDGSKDSRSIVGPIKFLNLPYYVSNKMAHLLPAGIDSRKPLRVLDVGCGPGHVHLMGRHFGHDICGFDVPLPDDRHVYNELCRFFGAAKTNYRVEAFQPLPRFPARFDLVTAVLINIGPWNAKQWQFFVQDVCTNLLMDGGALYLVFTTGSKTADAWQYVCGIAEWTHSERQAFIPKEQGMKVGFADIRGAKA